MTYRKSLFPEHPAAEPPFDGRDPKPPFDMCGNCGADAWEWCFFDPGDGWSCNRCFATDGGD